MRSNTKKIVVLSFALIMTVLAISGGTFAFFNARRDAANNVITGTVYQLDANVSVETIKSGNIIPVVDNLIMTSLNGSYPCEDNRGYRLCSLYKVTVTNSGSAILLNGYINTNTGTTFTTSDLKYQLLTKSGNTYTSASDVGVINTAVNSKNYFKLSSSNINFTLNNSGSFEYYVVLWLSDDGSNQLDTVNKVYKGSFTFETMNGGTVSATFNS